LYRKSIRVAAKPDFCQDSRVRKVLTIDPGDLNRPDFSKIVERMLKGRFDVELSSKTHVISLWRAINRAGYWSWSYRTGDAIWRVRLSKEPTTDKPNPLIAEYKRTSKTSYRQWRTSIPDLLAGKTITMPTKEDANRFSWSARYHLRKEKTPPFSITITPDRKKFAVRLVWKDAG